MKKLTKAELEHICEEIITWDEIKRLLKETVELQEKMGYGICWDCKFIAEKLGLVSTK